MNAIGTIARREVRAFVDYPTAYVLIIVFLALGLFLSLSTVLPQHLGTLRPFFDLLPWLFALFVPAITMRSLAEERRSHTLEWLMAQPVDETQVVVGKFLGDWAFVLIALGGTLPAAIGITMVASADPGIMAGQYVGAALLAGQAVSIGLWASAVTRNQITAFILAASVSLALLLLGLPIVSLGLPAHLGQAASLLAVLPHFTDVARGVIDLRDVLYFASTAALFLVLAGLAVSRERLSRGRGAYRRLRLGAVIVVVGVVMLNLLGGYIRGRLDLTRDRLYTISPQTRAIVRGLQDVAQIKFYVSGQLPPAEQRIERDVADLLADLQGASSGNLRVGAIDPDGDASAQQDAASFGIFPDTFNVRRSNQVQITRGWFGLVVLYEGQQRAIPVIHETDDLEYTLASDIASMAAASKPRVAFLVGFGARAPSEIPTVSRTIMDRYTVTPINLEGNLAALSPDSVRAAILIGPKQPLDSSAVAKLDSFVKGGGSALLMIQNVSVVQQFAEPLPRNTGLGPFLAAHGVALLPGIVFDTKANTPVPIGREGDRTVTVPYPLWPTVSRASEHETTRGLSNLTMSWPAPLDIRDPAHVTPLWKTTGNGGIRSVAFSVAPGRFNPQPSDVHGAQTVAVAVDPSDPPGRGAGGASQARRGGRLVVVGSADALDEDFVKSFPSDRENLTFVGNALDWLVQDETLIGIRSKHRAPPVLTFDSDAELSLFAWGNDLGIPVFVALFGVVRLAGRERRAKRRWEEDEVAPEAPASTQ